MGPSVPARQPTHGRLSQTFRSYVARLIVLAIILSGCSLQGQLGYNKTVDEESRAELARQNAAIQILAKEIIELKNVSGGINGK